MGMLCHIVISNFYNSPCVGGYSSDDVKNRLYCAKCLIEQYLTEKTIEEEVKKVKKREGA